MYLQSQPGYIILQDFDEGAFHQSGDSITLEHLQAVLRHISSTDVTLTKVHQATTWTDRARQATTYRNNRLLLAGDAAHIHSPLGGQGLNLGLGDALNLGWKLAATIQNKAPEGLLDTYFTERYPCWSEGFRLVKSTSGSNETKYPISCFTNSYAGFVTDSRWCDIYG
jgi:2-polyprenyl-6-methoxyphenol hydroxylase-like FAD-dependent oxidoreductase